MVCVITFLFCYRRFPRGQSHCGHILTASWRTSPILCMWTTLTMYCSQQSAYATWSFGLATTFAGTHAWDLRYVRKTCCCLDFICVMIAALYSQYIPLLANWEHLGAIQTMKVWLPLHSASHSPTYWPPRITLVSLQCHYVVFVLTAPNIPSDSSPPYMSDLSDFDSSLVLHYSYTSLHKGRLIPTIAVAHKWHWG